MTAADRQELAQWHEWKAHRVRVKRSTVCKLLNSANPTRNQLAQWLYDYYGVERTQCVIQPSYSEPEHWESQWEIRFEHADVWAFIVLGGLLA